jgi:hypothetical protein
MELTLRRTKPSLSSFARTRASDFAGTCGRAFRISLKRWGPPNSSRSTIRVHRLPNFRKAIMRGHGFTLRGAILIDNLSPGVNLTLHLDFM